MKKKIVAMLMATAMIVTGCIGCGSSDSEKNEKKAEDNGKKKVTVWAWDVEYNIPVMEEAAKRYEEKHRCRY